MIRVDKHFTIDYVDASGLSCFARCPARYLFQRLMGLELPDKSTIAVDYGTDIHRALPHCYKGADNIQTAVEQFTASWSSREHGESDEKRTTNHAVASLSQFAATHSPDKCPYRILNFPIKAPTATIISPNEIPFLVDIGGDLPAAGRIDVAVEWKTTNDLWVLDYKTSSEISSRYFKNFEGAPQTCLYTLALSQIANRRATGMIIEAIRVSKCNVETQMQMIYVKDEEITAFIRFANRISKAIIACNESKSWPKQLTGCSPYSMFGQPGRQCEYKMICEQSDWTSVLRFYKQTEPFHPFKVR